MTTILEYLQDLDRKGYTVMPAEITIQDVLNLVHDAGTKVVQSRMPAWIISTEFEKLAVDEAQGVQVNKFLDLMKEFPWNDEEISDEEYRARRKHEWQEWQERFNAPAVIEARGGMKLTPYGWRE